MSIEQDLTGKAQSDIARFKKGGVDIQVFSIFCDEQYGRDTAFKFANIEIDSLYAIVNRNPNRMIMVTDPKQLEEAVHQKKLGCMMVQLLPKPGKPPVWPTNILLSQSVSQRSP